jgi:hypothetical protein
MEAIGFEFVLLDLYDIVFILAIALSVLLRFTYSNYLFGIFQLFLPRKMSIQSFPFDSIDPSKNSRLFMFVNNLPDSDCVFVSWRQRKQRFKDTKGVINHNP